MPSLAPSPGEKKKVVICGGGLVGCLAACYYAKRNYDVSIYEYREDIRNMKVVVGRSINMAMSVRGREGLKRIGAEESITSKGIEMYSRMLHDTKGNTKIVPYGKKSQCILSIDRRYLNELLLTEAEKYENIKVHFGCKLVKCNTETGECVFQNIESKEEITVKSDLIVGCDGAYSAVRQSLLKDRPIDYSQEYISSYYLELNIPPKHDGTYALPTNHLHIWPRGQYMLIALPNQDRSFTCTLFMPYDMFKRVKTSEQIISFFEKNFIDALDLIGRDVLVECFASTKPSPLMHVKCKPHHGKKCVLFGDAAHAMVPFYGQGMNCGFEDVVVFFDLLDKFGFNCIDRVLELYSESRVPDAYAICDLALDNYIEMAHLVTTKKYMFRKYLDGILHTIFPNAWIPLYTMVTFTRLRYSEVVKKRQLQDKIIKHVGNLTLGTIGLAMTGILAFKLRHFLTRSY